MLGDRWTLLVILIAAATLCLTALPLFNQPPDNSTATRKETGWAFIIWMFIIIGGAFLILQFARR